jgi:hypothetical protein
VLNAITDNCLHKIGEVLEVFTDIRHLFKQEPFHVLLERIATDIRLKDELSDFAQISCMSFARQSTLVHLSLQVLFSCVKELRTLRQVRSTLEISAYLCKLKGPNLVKTSVFKYLHNVLVKDRTSLVDECIAL